MISDSLLVQQSLINNLFYLRTLREFSINIALSLFENNQEYINTMKLQIRIIENQLSREFSNVR